METYLITGGAGFIGSNFIKYLLSLQKDIVIINVDKLTYAGNLKNLKPVEAQHNYTFITQDICSRENIKKVFSLYKPDYVINFAAESHVDRSITDSETFARTNVLGTQILLQASLDYNIKRYIQISTDEVYGSSPDGTYFTEQSFLNPCNPYAASKAGADMLVNSFNITYNLPVNITRCTNNYGPGQHHEKLIPMVIKCCLEGKKIPVYGDGKNIRDWIYVDDHCRAIQLIIENGRPGEIYNIAAGNQMENIEIVKLIIEKSKDIAKIYYGLDLNIDESLIEFVEDRKGHDKRYALDTVKLSNELDWSAEKRFDEGLVQSIKWYMDNKPWLFNKK